MGSQQLSNIHHIESFDGCHHDLVNHQAVSVSQLTTDMFRLSSSQSGSFLIHDLSSVCNTSTTRSTAYGAVTAYLYRAHEFAPLVYMYQWGSCCSCIQLTCFHDFGSILRFPHQKGSSLFLYVLSGFQAFLMLFGFNYVYWCPTQFIYHMFFVSFNGNTAGIACGTEPIKSFRNT